MTIPSSFYLNRVLNNKINSYYNGIKDIEDSEEICIFLYFLFEFRKKETSEHYDYIASLPNDETYFPVFYSNDNKNMLRGSIINNYMGKKIRKIKDEFEALQERITELKNIDFKEYLKVRLTLGARIFETNKSDYVTSAVPIADLFNFNPEKVNCCWQINENNDFIVKAIQDIEENEEIFLFYGNQDNIYYLFWYAFTISDNPEKLKEYPIELEENNMLNLSIRYDFAELFQDYCKIRNCDNYLNSNNILKNKLKSKKMFDFIKDIKLILETRKSLYQNKNIEDDKYQLESFTKINDFNKINIMNIIIEEKSIIDEYLIIINLILEMYSKIEKGESIRPIYSLFMANYPNDKFVKFIFSSFNK